MLVGALARTPGTFLYAELTGDDWTRQEHILALVHDTLAMANWQRQGKRGRPRPKPMSPLARRQRDEQSVGDAGERTPEQTAMVLALYRTGAFDRGG